MILSDSEIRSRIQSGNIILSSQDGIDVLSQIWPASIDFRLGNTFKYYKRDNLTLIDPKESVEAKHFEVVTLKEGETFILHPRQFVLAVSLERIKVPYDLVARCEGRSSLGRLGLVIHSTAGYIDPWFEGTITLEMTNINEVPIALHPGMRIGQFAFELVHGTVEIPYDQRKGSKYMGQSLPQESKINQDTH